MKPPAENMSKYCTSQVPKAFSDLIENLDAKYLAVSYNNTYNSKSGSLRNHITIKQIDEILSRKGNVEKFSWYDDNQEFLFVVKTR